MTDSPQTTSAPAATGRPSTGRVLITGGASGLGAAVAQAVLAAGGEPIVLDLDTSSVTGMEAHRIDVSDTRATEALVTEIDEAASTPWSPPRASTAAAASSTSRPPSGRR
jgi:NAD(P)-dependent dehydrogenase (short-subunit alcohol dehydrogenase family)